MRSLGQYFIVTIYASKGLFSLFLLVSAAASCCPAADETINLNVYTGANSIIWS
jgi:hypothetical protein